MKLQKKTTLIYKNGYLVTKKNKVRMPSRKIVRQLNAIDKMMQMAEKAEYVNDKIKEIGEIDTGFTPISEHDPIMNLKVETPHLDDAIETTMNILKDIDATANTEKVKEAIDKYKDVFQFLEEDEYLVEDHGLKFDLPVIGNPLFLDSEDLVKMLYKISAADISALDIAKQE